MADHFVCSFKNSERRKAAVKEYLSRRYKIAEAKVIFKPCLEDKDLTEVFMVDTNPSVGEGYRVMGMLDGMGLGTDNR